MWTTRELSTFGGIILCAKAACGTSSGRLSCRCPLFRPRRSRSSALLAILAVVYGVAVVIEPVVDRGTGDRAVRTWEHDGLTIG